MYNKCTKTPTRLVNYLAFLSFFLLQLQVSAQNFTSLEKALKDPLAVKELTLKKSKLTDIPTEIATFKNLEVLDLSKNKITDVPDFIAELPKLHTLILSKNKISRFPTNLAQSPKLHVLNLDRNPIDTIPKEIKDFQALEELDLWDADIRFIDASITQLQTLRYLDVRNTYYKTSELQWIVEAMPELDLESSYGCNCD